MEAAGMTRTHRDTLAVLLVILGGATWLVGPMLGFVYQAHLSPDLAVPLATIAGCGLGAACVAAVDLRLARSTAIAGGILAGLIVRGGLVLWDQGPARALGAEDAALALGCAVAALIGGFVGTHLRRDLSVQLAAALTSLAVLAALFAAGGVLVQLGVDAIDSWGVLVLFGPIVGGAVAAALFTDVKPSTVFAGWMTMATLASVLLSLALGELGLVMAGLLATVVLVPPIAGLGALGAWIYRYFRPARPTGRDALPPARTLA
jgi:hypothetical protein